MKQQTIQLIKQQLKASQILRQTTFQQCIGSLSDNENKRCAIGVIASYLGWDGNKFGGNWISNFEEHSSLPIYDRVTEFLGFESRELSKKNDHGWTLDQIADWLEEQGK